MYSCIAIDDEPRALKLIERYCKDVPFLDLKATFDNPVEAFRYIENEHPDVMFVDIQMPEITGMDLVKSLNKKPLVVFTTAYSQYAVESYEIEAIDYLLKPFDFDRFMKTAQKIKRLLELNQQIEAAAVSPESKDSITVTSEYKKIQIKLADILFIESMDNYIRIYTTTQKYMVLRKLKSILEELPAPDFLQVHKSYIVSLDKIDYIRNNQIVIGKYQIPVGRSFSENLKKNIP